MKGWQSGFRIVGGALLQCRMLVVGFRAFFFVIMIVAALSRKILGVCVMLMAGDMGEKNVKCA